MLLNAKCRYRSGSFPARIVLISHTGCCSVLYKHHRSQKEREAQHGQKLRYATCCSFNEGRFNERLGLPRGRTILPPGRLPVRWLLSLLQLLLLLLVFLLQLLRLLLMPLLHLLLFPFIGLLIRQHLVLLVLLLLEFVSFQLLLCG